MPLISFLKLVLDLKEQILGDDAEAVPHFLDVALSLRWVNRSGRLRKVEQQNDPVVIVVEYRVRVLGVEEFAIDRILDVPMLILLCARRCLL